MSTIEERFLSLNNKTKRADNFIVEFLGMPENVSNILGRQVKSIVRPTISFMPAETRFRGMKYMDKGNVEFDPTQISMWDDEGGITSTLLYAQVFRQLNKFRDINGQFPDENPKERDYRFNIRVRLYDSLDNVVEEYVLKRCFITEISHIDPEMTDDSETTLNITVAFDNIGITVFDEYIEFLDEQSVNP
jgi:hypothetical protein